jgi:hypothetical protein
MSLREHRIRFYEGRLGPAHAGKGKATATLAASYVTHLGIHELGGGRVAWLREPGGNSFAIEP